jgi:hypothetical protein
MEKSAIAIACSMLVFYGIMEAHVVDIHVKTPSEIAEEERHEKQRENDKAREIFEDETRSEEERRDALEVLVENEEIV